jgi:hypothetical protein
MMPLPEEWRLLNQTGSFQRGQVMIGTSERVLLEIAWDVVIRKKLDAVRLSDRHLKRLLKAQKLTFAQDEIVSLEHPEFASVRVVEKERLIFVIAWNEKTRRIFQFAYQRQSTRKDRKFLDEILGSFVDQPRDRPQLWDFLGTQWMIPAGYEMEFALLNLGDLRLGFTFSRSWGRKGLLQCRQLYPADFALEKQGHAQRTEYFYSKMANQYYIPKKGILKRKLRYSDFSYKHFTGIACKARLHPLLRTLFRPFVFRNPTELWTLSVVHVPANRLVQLHFGGDRLQADEILSYVLDSLRWHHWQGDESDCQNCNLHENV